MNFIYDKENICQKLRQIWPEIGEPLSILKIANKPYMFVFYCYIRVSNNGGPSNKFN